MSAGGCSVTGMRWILRGILAAAVIVGFALALGYQPVLLAVCLLIAAAAMLWKSWVLASRAEVTR
jgi:hypothetical protein